jgi:hypothetical protein
MDQFINVGAPFVCLVTTRKTVTGFLELTRDFVVHLILEDIDHALPSRHEYRLRSKAGWIIRIVTLPTQVLGNLPVFTGDSQWEQGIHGVTAVPSWVRMHEKFVNDRPSTNVEIGSNQGRSKCGEIRRTVVYRIESVTQLAISMTFGHVELACLPEPRQQHPKGSPW